jgi:hypothetical protein
MIADNIQQRSPEGHRSANFLMRPLVMRDPAVLQVLTGGLAPLAMQ